MIGFEDESLNEIMEALQIFLDKGVLSELHMVNKNKIVSVSAIDRSGWKYTFVRNEP